MIQTRGGIGSTVVTRPRVRVVLLDEDSGLVPPDNRLSVGPSFRGRSRIHPLDMGRTRETDETSTVNCPVENRPEVFVWGPRPLPGSLSLSERMTHPWTVDCTSSPRTRPVHSRRGTKFLLGPGHDSYFGDELSQ